MYMYVTHIYSLSSYYLIILHEMYGILIFMDTAVYVHVSCRIIVIMNHD